MKYLNRFNKLSDYVGSIDNLEYPSTSFIDEDDTIRYGLPEELMDKVKAVWIPYGKSNSDEDKNIITDLSGHGNDLELTGFQWNKDSGYSDYSNDFTTWSTPGTYVNSVSKNKIIGSGVPTEGYGRYFLITGPQNPVIPSSFKVRITGLENSNDNLSYHYTTSDGTESSVSINHSGIYELPASEISNEYNGFNINTSSDSIIIIEQIPNNEHALITSGSSDELISSKDPISKITGNSNTITVLSVVENLDEKEIFVNFIGGDPHGSNIRNSLLTDSGICVSGYSGTSEDENPTLINTILGDIRIR